MRLTDSRPRRTARSDDRPAQPEDVRAWPLDREDAGGHAGSTGSDARGRGARAARGPYASSLLLRRDGCGNRGAGRNGGLGHRRRGSAQRGRRRHHRSRLRAVHRLPGHRHRPGTWIAGPASSPRRPVLGAPSPSQHGASRRRSRPARALPETARPAPPEHARRRRDIPRAPLPGRPPRQSLFHVDRARRLRVSHPPGLHVFASVFSGLVRRGAGDMALLRIITCSVDAVAACCYGMVVRAWGNRPAGAMAVAIYHLMPLDLCGAHHGNLTNAFAQAVAVGALVLMASATVSVERWGATACWRWSSPSRTCPTRARSRLFVATAQLPRSSGCAAGRCLIAGGRHRVRDGRRRRARRPRLLRALQTHRAEFARIGRETASGAQHSPAAGRSAIVCGSGRTPSSASISVHRSCSCSWARRSWRSSARRTA